MQLLTLFQTFAQRVRACTRVLARRSWLATAVTFAAVPCLSAQTIDAFNPQPQTAPTTLAIQADGKVLIGGYFLDVPSSTLVGVQRLNADGSIDAGFVEPAVSAEVKALALQADGKILIGGSFIEVAGHTQHYLARLNANGSLDTSFLDPNLDADVWAIALQPDGKVLAAGDFQNVGTTARAYAARFTTTGALDGSFVDTQICCGPARAIALQANGSVLVGGYFLGVTGNSAIGSIARFSASGALDAAFPVDPSATTVSAIVVGPDGSIYVGSSYRTSDDQSLRPVAKLSASGTLDIAYADMLTDGGTNTLALEPNGKLMFGGQFQLIDGQPRHALARLNANGILDAGFVDLNFNFDAGDPNGYIFGLAAQADGNTIAIGNFTLAAGQSRPFAARVVTGDAVLSKLVGQASGSSVIATWMRSGDGAELALPPNLLHSSDGLAYTVVGPMTRIATGWQATANYNVNGAPFYLKATGMTSTGAANGSSGWIASPVYVSDRIFANGFD
ncbi:MAG: hypothetical protein ABIO74_10885 [Dokdonella sp.]